MDCRTALEILDVVRPDSDDLNDPELASAAEHVGSCAQCEVSFRSRQDFDRRVGRLMRDVAVPSGLKQRLLADAAVATDSPSAERRASRPGSAGDVKPPGETSVTTSPAADVASVSVFRRRGFHVAWLSAVSLLAAVVVWQMVLRQETPAISVADLQAGNTALAAVSEMMANPDRLAGFDDGFAVVTPAGWAKRVAFSGGGKAKGFRLEGRDDRLLALYAFRFQARRMGPVRGVLMAVPAERVADPPAATSLGMATGRVKYVTVAGLQCAGVTWTEGELVYVAFVPADALDPLKQLLQVSPV